MLLSATDESKVNGFSRQALEDHSAKFDTRFTLETMDNNTIGNVIDHKACTVRSPENFQNSNASLVVRTMTR